MRAWAVWAATLAIVLLGNTIVWTLVATSGRRRASAGKSTVCRPSGPILPRRSLPNLQQ